MSNSRPDLKILKTFLTRPAVFAAAILALSLFGSGSLLWAEPVSPGEISADELQASPFTPFFKEQNYPRALAVLEKLAQKYPGDPLISRYKAMTLDQMGRSSQAIAIYQELLKRDPNHVPTRFFLGQAYFRAGKEDLARKEWQWVAENSPVDLYRQMAQQQMSHPRAAPVQPERFYWFGSVGVEYDSNPLLKPNDKELASSGNEKQGFRFPLTLGVGNHLIRRSDLRVDATYTARQSFHDANTQDVDFTSQEAALDSRRRVHFADRDVVLGARYEFLAGFLRSDLFSIINRLLFSSDIRLTPQTRTVLLNRFSTVEFGPDGSNPPQTSRDGYSDEIGVTQYFYSQDFRKYLYVEQTGSSEWTRGANFTRRGFSTRVGIHMPTPFQQTDLDLSGGLDYGQYPRFASLSSLDTRRRRDRNWDFYAALTHHWNLQWATRGFYRFVNADNRNDFFDYDRHIAGVQMIFTQ